MYLERLQNQRLGSTAELRRAVDKKFKDIKLSCGRAIILVGGILSDGTASSSTQRNRLAAKRVNKYYDVTPRIDRGPTAFDFRERCPTVHASPVAFHASEQHLFNATTLHRMASTAHRVLLAGKPRAVPGQRR